MYKKSFNFTQKIKNCGRNIFWSNLNQGILVLSFLLNSIIFTRLGGMKIYGDFLLLYSILGLLSIISISGVRETILRSVSQGYDRTYFEATKFSLLWSLIGIPILLLIGLYYYFFQSSLLGITLMISSLVFPFFASLQTWMFIMKGKADFKRLALYNLLLKSVQLIMFIVTLTLTKNIMIIFLIYIFIESIFNIIYYLQNEKKYVTNSMIDSGWRKQSYTLSVMDLSSIIFGKADIIIMSIFLNSESVAIYGVIMKILDAFFVGINGSMTAILPQFYKSNKIKINNFYKIIFLSILIPLLLKPIIEYPIIFLYGQVFSEAIIYTQMYLFVIPFFLISKISNHFLIKYKLNNVILITKFVAMISVLILYLVLIPAYGITGGIISSILYFVIQSIINIYIINKINPKPNISNPLLL